MIEVKARVREWGRSLGVVLPKDAAEVAGIRKDDTVTLLIAKSGSSLKKTFGTLKFRRSTEEMLKESDRESWDE